MRALAILVLTVSTLFIWIASSPMSLDASALTPSAQFVVPTARPQPATSAVSDRGALAAPVALLLQGLVFLACGSLWPEKSKTSSSAPVRGVVVPRVEQLRN